MREGMKHLLLLLLAFRMVASVSAQNGKVLTYENQWHTLTTVGREPQPERTDWFMKHGYGIFAHYLSVCQNNAENIASLGKQTSWDECVNAFDTERFADRIKETGAGYVIFTIMQRRRFMIAPNETFNRLTGYKTGEACSTRDLIEDLYQSLHKRNIDLMLYFTGDAAIDDPQAAKGLKFEVPLTEEFVRNWSAVAAEYGLRYKDKVKGYWVDGCYPALGYNENLYKIFAEGLLAGNSDRIIAFNIGIVGYNIRSASVYEDYTAGEQNSFTLIPDKGRFIDGAQWHLLCHLGTYPPGGWMAWGKPGIAMEKEELAQYVYDVNSLGGVVSFDVLLYRDGDLDRSQVEVFKPLRERLAALKKEERRMAKTQSKNLAWKKPASLRSNDNLQELISGPGPSRNALRGTDGKLETFSQPINVYPWTYEVDLLELHKIRHVKVHFFKSYYPTDVEVFGIDASGKEISFGHFTDQKGDSLDVNIVPMEVTKIRVRSYKPDGPNQPGNQMTITEVEIYE
jgi:hypothetical protein